MKNITPLAIAFGLGIVFTGCERKRPVDDAKEITVDTAEKEDTIERDTTKVVRTGETTEEKLEELRGWMNEKSTQGDSAIRSDWPEVREKIRQRTAELDKNVDSLSAKSRQEYNELKQRYERWEAREQRRQQMPLSQQKITQWQNQLLGEYKDIDKITAKNIREAYLTFMGVVRTKRRSWTQSDWDYVDYVYSKLNERRGQVEGQISTSDNFKIRTLQGEYLTLEGAADTQSMLNDVKD
ncbi:hypothetical protein [Pontibacter vulgaris]|uniref:hypothetical protein n=1 Tax=Pontibacter vulgaris TaxID=2905679 RepID=UPI001FA6E55B|nr:hypothetical protein [Pontibacter vulgaris]